jgi:tRNA(Ile)-lysidine synthase
MSALEKAVLSSLDGLNADCLLLAAVSGGADSTGMLTALAELGVCRPFRLAALHVNHGLRGDESRADAEAASALCKNLDIPCTVVTAPDGEIAERARQTGSGIEAAARDFRHGALNEELARLGAERILIAHTKDDLLENTLIRILRGAGPAGLAAMPQSTGKILRPLLTVRHAEIITYLQSKGVSWREDSSNSDERFLRNRVRRRLIPVLDGHFPDWRTTILSLAETQVRVADFLAAEAEKRVRWEDDGKNILSYPADDFFSEPEIVREEALFAASNRLSADAPPPRRAVIRDFSEPGEAGASKKSLSLGGVNLSRKDGKVMLCAENASGGSDGFSLLIDKPGIYKIKGWTIECIGDEGKTGERFRFIVTETKSPPTSVSR